MLAHAELRQDLTHWAISTAYRARRSLIRLPLLATHITLGRVVSASDPAPDPNVVKSIRRRYAALLAADLGNVRAGLYPAQLLFSDKLARHVRALPEFLRQIPATIRRARAGNHKDIPSLADERYPAYYRRTFHWQTDGYFSERSARVYDLQVDWLFLGMTDVMRRQVVPPIVQHARCLDRPARVLDVACGTGRTLWQLREALPDATLAGIDLSPFYVAHAQEQLGAGVQLMAENAECMSFADASFDVVTSTFLFHELPRDVRRRVLAEMHRVLVPGGLLVIEDSAQLSDSPEIAAALVGFSQRYHEPYYKGYIADDLATAVEETGFAFQGEATHFVAKVVTARKPLSGSNAEA